MSNKTLKLQAWEFFGVEKYIEKTRLRLVVKYRRRLNNGKQTLL